MISRFLFWIAASIAYLMVLGAIEEGVPAEFHSTLSIAGFAGCMYVGLLWMFSVFKDD